MNRTSVVVGSTWRGAQRSHARWTYRVSSVSERTITIRPTGRAKVHYGEQTWTLSLARFLATFVKI
jgi:hypothetical protein